MPHIKKEAQMKLHPIHLNRTIKTERPISLTRRDLRRLEQVAEHCRQSGTPLHWMIREVALQTPTRNAPQTPVGGTLSRGSHNDRKSWRWSLRLLDGCGTPFRLILVVNSHQPIESGPPTLLRFIQRHFASRRRLWNAAAFSNSTPRKGGLLTGLKAFH